jgi:hypothetical protein
VDHAKTRDPEPGIDSKDFHAQIMTADGCLSRAYG